MLPQPSAGALHQRERVDVERYSQHGGSALGGFSSRHARSSLVYLLAGGAPVFVACSRPATPSARASGKGPRLQDRWRLALHRPTRFPGAMTSTCSRLLGGATASCPSSQDIAAGPEAWAGCRAQHRPFTMAVGRRTACPKAPGRVALDGGGFGVARCSDCRDVWLSFAAPRHRPVRQISSSSAHGEQALTPADARAGLGTISVIGFSNESAR